MSFYKCCDRTASIDTKINQRGLAEKRIVSRLRAELDNLESRRKLILSSLKFTCEMHLRSYYLSPQARPNGPMNHSTNAQVMIYHADLKSLDSDIDRIIKRINAVT